MVEFDAFQLHAIILPSLNVEPNNTLRILAKVDSERQDVRTGRNINRPEGFVVHRQANGNLRAGRVRAQIQRQGGEIGDVKLQA